MWARCENLGHICILDIQLADAGRRCSDYLKCLETEPFFLTNKQNSDVSAEQTHSLARACIMPLTGRETHVPASQIRRGRADIYFTYIRGITLPS